MRSNPDPVEMDSKNQHIRRELETCQANPHQDNHFKAGDNNQSTCVN
jgi:hypothetical protein